MAESALRSDRRRLHRIVAVGAAAILLAATTNVLLRRNAQAYVERALDIAEAHHVRRNEVNWRQLRAETHQRSALALTLGQTHPAIESALRQLDHHSGLIEPDIWLQASVPNGFVNRKPDGRLVASRFAYIDVPAFVGINDATMVDEASEIQAVIARVDLADPCGWIVDLRTNTGGNMWPMLAGLSPILGEGVVGSFVTPDGTRTLWSIRDGGVKDGSDERVAVRPAHHLTRPNAPVAVLVGRMTNSSGEAVAVAFQGRPLTTTFGAQTAGNTTSNQPFQLSDGAFLNLSVAFFADRIGHVYRNGLEPDARVAAQPGDVPPDVVHWLEAQPACGAPLSSFSGRLRSISR